MNIQVTAVINTANERLSLVNLKKVHWGHWADKCQTFHSPDLSDFERRAFLLLIILLYSKLNFWYVNLDTWNFLSHDHYEHMYTSSLCLFPWIITNTLQFWKYIISIRYVGYCIFVFCILGVILTSSEAIFCLMSVWILLWGPKFFRISVWAAYWCGNLASWISGYCMYQNHLGNLLC